MQKDTIQNFLGFCIVSFSLVTVFSKQLSEINGFGLSKEAVACEDIKECGYANTVCKLTLGDILLLNLSDNGICLITVLSHARMIAL